MQTKIKINNFNSINDIDSLCRYYANQHVIALVPGGNRGDGLIYLGARALLQKHNINVKEVYKLDKAKGKILFIYGCGGYAKAYGTMPRRIGKYLNNFETVVIFPSSFDTSINKIKNFVMTLPNHVLVFCREKYSYNNVKKYIKNKRNVKLDHDTALHFNYDIYKKNGKGRIYSYRRDREAKKKWFGHDKSIDASYGTSHTYRKMIEIISNYHTVVTDRAHIMILAAKLGKKTHVLPSNYFKIKGIYEYSLKNYPNVHFHENDNFLINEQKKIQRRREQRKRKIKIKI